MPGENEFENPRHLEERVARLEEEVRTLRADLAKLTEQVHAPRLSEMVYGGGVPETVLTDHPRNLPDPVLSNQPVYEPVITTQPLYEAVTIGSPSGQTRAPKSETIFPPGRHEQHWPTRVGRLSPGEHHETHRQTGPRVGGSKTN